MTFFKVKTRQYLELSPRHYYLLFEGELYTEAELHRDFNIGLSKAIALCDYGVFTRVECSKQDTRKVYGSRYAKDEACLIPIDD